MTPGISTHVFFDQRLHSGLLDALAAAGVQSGIQTGAGSMTIEVFAARHHFDYTDPQSVRELAAWFRSNPVRAVLHQPIYTPDSARAVSHLEPAAWSRHIAPNLNLISERKQARIAAMDEVKRAIESAEQVPFAAVVIHLGLRDTAWDEAAIDNSMSAIEHLKAFAAPLGVRLLLENLQSEVTTPEHLLYILRTGHFDTVGVSLDIGHLHLTQPGVPPPGADPDSTPALIPPADSGVAAAIELLGPRIAQLHLHDNHGPFTLNGSQPSGTPSQTIPESRDEHLWPGEGAPGDGTIDWATIAPLLATLPAATPFLLEPAANRDLPTEQVTRKAAATFRTLAEQASAPVSPNM